MRTLSYVLIGLSIACEIFGYWGLDTVSGRRVFDEMAGIIPFAAKILGILFALGAIVAWWFSRARP